MAYCTATQIKAVLKSSSATDDTLLGLLADRATALMDAYCKRTLIATADSDRYFTVGRDTEGAYLWFDDLCASVTTVLNGDSASTEVTSTQYALIDRNHGPYWGIKILGSAGKSWQYVTDPEDAIKVTGAWAWFDVAAVPADIVHTAIRLSIFLYRQGASSTDLDRPILTDSGATLLPSQLPADVKTALNPYRKL